MGERNRRRAAANRRWHDRPVEYRGYVQRPSRESACWHPSDWNRVARTLDGELSFVTSELLMVPEGIVSVMRCSRCGGRQEERFDAFRSSEHDVEHVATLVAAPHGRFKESHRACTKAKRSHTLPARVASILDSRLAHAERAIRAGRRCDAYISLLTDTKEYRIDGVQSLVPGSVNGGRDRLHGIAQLHFGIRALIAHEDIAPLGVVLVTEAWSIPATGASDSWSAPSGAANRTEALSILVVTPSFARTGVATITRDGGRLDAGPGVLGEVTWAEVGPSALIDGMLAQSAAPLSLVREALEQTPTDPSVRSLLD